MAHLKFAHIEYSISTRSLDIFFIGCGDGDIHNPICKGCCNPEIRDWNLKGFSTIQVVSKVVQLDTKYGNLIDKILLVGGDPLDSYFRYREEFIDFINQLGTIEKPIFLFTRYELNNIPNEILCLVDYVKTGPYIPSLTCKDNIQFGINLATSNQNIYNAKEVLNTKRIEVLNGNK